MPRLSMIAALAALSGCALEPTPFDGRYRGAITLTRDFVGNLCPATLNQTLTVVNGQASLPIIPSHGWVAYGQVDRGGVVTPVQPPNVNLNARIAGERLTGTLADTTCAYALALERQRP